MGPNHRHAAQGAPQHQRGQAKVPVEGDRRILQVSEPCITLLVEGAINDHALPRCFCRDVNATFSLRYDVQPWAGPLLRGEVIRSETVALPALQRSA